MRRYSCLNSTFDVQIATMSEKKLPYMIYAEITPNPATMKFVSNHPLALNGDVYEFSNEAEAKLAPLAARLFSFPFVEKVFIAQNFITLVTLLAVFAQSQCAEREGSCAFALAIKNTDQFEASPTKVSDAACCPGKRADHTLSADLRLFFAS